jgi:hypothetical protein
MADKIDPPDAGKTSVRMGPAFLRPSAKEPNHYELVRPVITVRNEGDRVIKEQHGDPIPLAIYRTKRKGDKIDMTKHSVDGPSPELKTQNPVTKQPLELVLVWWSGQT